MDTLHHRLTDSSPPPEPSPLLSIAAVERETGLGKDTLRAWERRYGFPMPQRDAAGVRGYPRALVERLRLIRRALLNGQRPGRLLTLPPEELDALLASIAVAPDARRDGPESIVRALQSTTAAGDAPAVPPLDVADCLTALRSGGAEALRHWLTRGLARVGLAAFVIDGLAPLTASIGHSWVGGHIAVYEEHLYSEAVQTVLRAALAPFQAGMDGSAPRVLLTTVPGEQHALGLLMAETLMALEGCLCLSLGVQTPLDDIGAATEAHRIDVVALSFSEGLPAAEALSALIDLRARLPRSVSIWAGGGAPALRAQVPSGIQVMRQLVDIPEAVAAWRRDSGEIGT